MITAGIEEEKAISEFINFYLWHLVLLINGIAVDCDFPLKY